ncbi:nuclear transport factor 2 family protein [Pseudoalteromonas aurantia]|uniref:SnoaL-like domain-containing protein n=1 Tax=Pseudoalteromonas aurantia 208 TaxID=1314867 RepID=A0ABR9EBN8_9GAMM|nr:ester cyclase [Pseudoalteromonas aurantia]MBE0368401.1 hypothetical protein [Pseudoalteromonas aurantia 208]
MKNYVFMCLLFLFSFSATASNVEEVLDSYFNSWNTHNKAAIKSYFAPDVVWYDLATNTTKVGKEKVAPAIINYFMGYVKDMYWYRSGDVYISGNTIIYEWTYGGTFNGNWGESKITRKVFSLKGISTTSINDDGKIIAQKDYYDMDSFKRAVGVKP